MAITTNDLNGLKAKLTALNAYLEANQLNVLNQGNAAGNLAALKAQVVRLQFEVGEAADQQLTEDEFDLLGIKVDACADNDDQAAVTGIVTNAITAALAKIDAVQELTNDQLGAVASNLGELLAKDLEEIKGLVAAQKEAAAQRLEAERLAAKTALQLIVEAYNEVVKKEEGEQQTTKSKPEKDPAELFAEKLKSKLGIDRDAPKGFEKAAKDCFTDLRRIHKNKGSEQTLEVGDINPRTCGQTTRDLLVMVAQIILFPLVIARGLAAVGIINQERVDWMITDSSSKQSAVNHSKGFQKMLEKQKAQPAAVQVN